MTTYVALLRGIGPTNPNMRGEKLRTVFEELGFKNVATVIGSGNVVFTSRSQNATALERKIETALPKRLAFKSTTIIRSQKELKALVKKNPFKGKKHSRESYLLVTFFKDKQRARGGVLCTSHDVHAQDTTDFMRRLEQRHGKEITSRTYLTIERILKKMENIQA